MLALGAFGRPEKFPPILLSGVGSLSFCSMLGSGIGGGGGRAIGTELAGGGGGRAIGTELAGGGVLLPLVADEGCCTWLVPGCDLIGCWKSESKKIKINRQESKYMIQFLIYKTINPISCRF